MATAPFRTVFISDLHLGTRRAHGDMVLDFLRHTRCEALFLVGDITDNWALKRRWFWNETHGAVLRALLDVAARGGTAVTYLPGNHDCEFRRLCGENVAGIRVCDDVVHETADGRRVFVLHGDRYDGVVLSAPWLEHLGGVLYEWAIRANLALDRALRLMRFPGRSMASLLRHRAKRSGTFVAQFERSVVDEAKARGCDAVVCGHLHIPAHHHLDGVEYCNDGDWVDNCTALVEHFDGRLELIDWARDRERLLADAREDQANVVAFPTAARLSNGRLRETG